MKCERALVGGADWAVAMAAKKRLIESFFIFISSLPRFYLLERERWSGRETFACNCMDRNELGLGSQVSSRQPERDHRLLRGDQNILLSVPAQVRDRIRKRVRRQLRLPQKFPRLRF